MTWKDVLEQRRELGKTLIEPLSEEEKRLLEYVLNLELEHRHLKQPPIVAPLLKYLEDHIS